MTALDTFVLRQFSRRKRGGRLAAFDATPTIRRRVLEMVDDGLLRLQGGCLTITEKGKAALRPA